MLRWRLNPEPSKHDLAVVANLRVALNPEPHVSPPSPRTRERVGGTCADGQALGTVDDPEAFVEADLSFHRSIFVASGNELAIHP